MNKTATDSTPLDTQADAGRAPRVQLRRQALKKWLLSEAHELRDAPFEENEIDEIIDCLGILALFLDTYEDWQPSYVGLLAERWREKQARRGRPHLDFNRIRQLLDALK